MGITQVQQQMQEAMKDPEVQKQMQEAMKDPEVTLAEACLQKRDLLTFLFQTLEYGFWASHFYAAYEFSLKTSMKTSTHLF